MKQRSLKMKIYGTVLKHPYTGYTCYCCPGETKRQGRKKARQENNVIIEEELHIWEELKKGMK